MPRAPLITRFAAAFCVEAPLATERLRRRTQTKGARTRSPDLGGFCQGDFGTSAAMVCENEAEAVEL